MSDKIIFSPGSFFHGTKADLNIGDFLVTGMKKNYNDDRKSGYVYFAGTLDAAIWGAELAEGDGGFYSISQRTYFLLINSSFSAYKILSNKAAIKNYRRGNEMGGAPFGSDK